MSAQWRGGTKERWRHKEEEKEIKRGIEISREGVENWRRQIMFLWIVPTEMSNTLIQLEQCTTTLMNFRISKRIEYFSGMGSLSVFRLAFV